ncbi:MAG TPA: Arm DNA-binding domain-containing protein, partial [Methyloceanibacter sp.]|nr:Arm DNA-binding domain-containing protein [Methyloceanibacter sp.]
MTEYTEGAATMKAPAKPRNTESIDRFTQVGVRTLRIPKKSDKPNRYRKIAKIKRGLGLVLLVSYSGTKTWRVLYYVKGKPRTKRLGTFPDTDVSEAYKKACKFDPESA